jgi:hypothetical protein
MDVGETVRMTPLASMLCTVFVIVVFAMCALSVQALWPEWLSAQLRVVRYIAPRLVFWILTVHLLALVPIVLHLGAVLANGDHQEYQAEKMAEGFLYAFIVASAGITDTITDKDRGEMPSVTVGLIITAVISAALYGAANVRLLREGPAGPTLPRVLPYFLILSLVPYAIYKITVLWGEARGSLKPTSNLIGEEPQQI